MSESEIQLDHEVTSSEDAIFDDIRPCRDEEVHDELAKIVNDEKLIDGIIKLRFPHLKSFLNPILRMGIRFYLKREVKGINTIADFQGIVAKSVKGMIADTTDGVTFSGFDKLDPKKGYLFMSNHRDISLDPAFIDYALHQHKFDTVRIAIGDNLLKMQAATALMRLNKSFIVKRSVPSPRDKLREFNHLSHYIGLSLKEGHSIWIAQREGRAKDGYDRTEEAVLKMIFMHGRTERKSFAEYMSNLNIVPVSITYEIDPGDYDKAHELNERELNDGKYQKGDLEDIKSIIKGIKGYKGRVSVIAGEPISGGFETPEELATIIDNFIYSNYAIYPSVLLSACKLGMCDESKLSSISEEDRAKFEERINSYPENLRERILRMYAAPYDNQKRIGVIS